MKISQKVLGGLLFFDSHCTFMCQIAHFLSYLGEAVVFLGQHIWLTDDNKLKSPRKALFVRSKTATREKFLLSGITAEIVVLH